MPAAEVVGDTEPVISVEDVVVVAAEEVEKVTAVIEVVHTP